MSDYPSTPHYGTNYGGQNLPNTPYLPPTYSNQYMQPEDGHMRQHQYAPNYDANMAAHGYNGAAPGFSAAALASGAPPLPIYQGWNQDHVPLPAYNPQHNAMQPTGYTANTYNNYPQQYAPPQQSYQNSILQAKPYDEGEVSEGDFDGGYAPQNPTPVVYGATQYGANGSNGYIDTAQRAMYAPPSAPAPQPETEYNYSREVPQLRRQQSDSYSPCAASSIDDHHDNPAVPYQQQNTVKPTKALDRYTNGSVESQNKASWDQKRSTNTPRTSSHANENHSTKGTVIANAKHPLPSKVPSAQRPPPSTTIAQPNIRNALITTPAVQAAPIAEAPTVVYDRAEMRKKAEGAILNLLPHDIRFEKYTEEGIAEDVIGPLFDGLKVPRTTSKSLHDTGLSSNAEEKQKIIIAASGKTKTIEKGTQPLLTSAPNSNLLDQAQKATQFTPRNPPTAPLAERSRKLSLSIAASISSPNATINPATTAAATEKEQTLKKKMEALRKSREERAQKAAAKTNVTSSVASTSASLAFEPDISKLIPVSSSSSHSTTSSQLATTEEPQIQSVISQTPLQRISTQQAPTNPAPLAIPGLFLASAAASPTPSITNGSMNNSNNKNNNNQISQRKRPVAADFVNATPTAFKRPFGHTRSDTPLVIDVSEDEVDSEDGDVAMDLDSQADQDSPTQPARKMSDQPYTPMNNLPTMTSFLPRKPYTPPQASAASTPTSRKPTFGRPEDLQAKEIAIEELRRKIAEAEAAKAQKKAKQSTIGTHTPQPVNATEESTLLAIHSMAKKVETSKRIQSMIDATQEKVNLDQQRILEAQAVEEEKAAELKNQEVESKRLRRQKIATDLPRIDAEVLEKQERLEQLKAEMAEMEAEVQRNIREKERMAEEMETLGQEAEDQLQEQKEKLRDLTQMDSEPNAIFSAPFSSPPVDTKDDLIMVQPTDASQAAQPLFNGNAEFHKQPSPVQLEREPSIRGRDKTPVSEMNQHDEETLPSTGSPMIPMMENAEDGTADQDLEAALQQAVRAEADAHDSHEEGEVDEEMDVDDSYAPYSNQSTQEPPPVAKDDVDRSPSYSTVLERRVSNVSDPRSDFDYEPPSVAPPIDSPAIQSPPFSPAPPDPISEDAEDAEDLLIFPSDASPLTINDIKTIDSSLPQTNGSVPMLVEDSSTAKSDQTPLFTPYESPLKHFRAFRFHPSFNQEVSGGFRSLTYTHKIDPTTEMCPWEMAGGACNDQTCEYQHLKNILLPDDDVLSSLGSPDDFKGERRKQYCDGLKEVLTGLRASKIRDFDSIAQKIVAYRARFLGDDKVLVLEGTTL